MAHNPSTVGRAYELARSGKFAQLSQIKEQLKAEGCRAVDVQLAGGMIQGHLRAICAAIYKAPETEVEEPAQTG
jgi:hypothetical protein